MNDQESNDLISGWELENNRNLKYPEKHLTVVDAFEDHFGYNWLDINNENRIKLLTEFKEFFIKRIEKRKFPYFPFPDDIEENFYAEINKTLFLLNAEFRIAAEFKKCFQCDFWGVSEKDKIEKLKKMYNYFKKIIENKTKFGKIILFSSDQEFARSLLKDLAILEENFGFDFQN